MHVFNNRFILLKAFATIMRVIFTDSQKMRWLKKLQNTQKIKDAELAAEMITHLRDGTLD